MSKSYFPLHVHSHYSLLDGLSKPADVVKRCEEIDVGGSAVTDHGSVSGHIKFLTKMNKAGKKPLLGCEFYVSREDSTIKNERNRRLDHLCIIAKNDEGWRDMMEMVSQANTPEHFYYKPRLDLKRIFSYASRGNLMAYSGHIGSNMCEILYDENADLSSNWKNSGQRLAKDFKEAFGQDNFFLEVQLMDQEEFPRQTEIGDCIREISELTGIPCVATQDAHYARKEDAVDQRILLCSQLNYNLSQLGAPESGLSGFARSRQFHIPTYEEMKQWHTDEELENTLLFASRVSEYQKILKQPVLPNFQCPEGMNADSYLRKLCDDGLSQRVGSGVITQGEHAKYVERLEKELGVLQGAGLSAYFLVVSDIVRFVRSNGWLPGPGRGSAAGCLVSYLTEITSIDPLPFGLFFERFYNAGRNTGGHISMPDIDIDVPKYAREHVVQYIRDKYGADHVGQMVTFQTKKGRGALKDVLKAYSHTDMMTFEEMNKITKNIIEESKISDELQRMKEETGDSSIIRWCLENTPKKLDSWCKLEDDGTLSGPLAQRFEQAMRLEGTNSAQSKHPAGVVIAPEPLSAMFPMIHDKETGNPVAGFEMDDMESVGGTKYDVLGVAMLDKCMGVEQDLAYGDIHEIQ